MTTHWLGFCRIKFQPGQFYIGSEHFCKSVILLVQVALWFSVTSSVKLNRNMDLVNSAPVQTNMSNSTWKQWREETEVPIYFILLFCLFTFVARSYWPCKLE